MALEIEYQIFKTYNFYKIKIKIRYSRVFGNILICINSISCPLCTGRNRDKVKRLLWAANGRRPYNIL